MGLPLYSVSDTGSETEWEKLATGMSTMGIKEETSLVNIAQLGNREIIIATPASIEDTVVDNNGIKLLESSKDAIRNSELGTYLSFAAVPLAIALIDNFEGFGHRAFVNNSSPDVMSMLREESKDEGFAWVQLLGLSRVTRVNRNLAEIMCTTVKLDMGKELTPRLAMEAASLLDQICAQALSSIFSTGLEIEIELGSPGIAGLIMNNRNKAINVIGSDGEYRIEVSLGNVVVTGCGCGNDICTCFTALDEIAFVSFTSDRDSLSM